MRETYERQYESALTELVKIFMKSFKHKNVILYTEKLIQLDNLNEEAYLNTIEAFVKLNNLSKAKSIVNEMYETFQKEIGEKPSEKTIENIKELLTDF
jgi:DNA-binding SARP family transcriptional activator